MGDWQVRRVAAAETLVGVTTDLGLGLGPRPAGSRRRASTCWPERVRSSRW
ncbi:hypothetical protein AB0F91_10840 [Amycolatopsis sp. NPDC023774]|uniref:hypothetical protein n=1 Tax=Amycolatopsis sp. NPDC023774 TaxID=3155015 RepID=UPI0033E54E1A